MQISFIAVFLLREFRYFRNAMLSSALPGSPIRLRAIFMTFQWEPGLPLAFPRKLHVQIDSL